MNNYAYMIYQIKNIGKTLYAFRSWDEAKELIDMEDYKGVYYGNSIDAETEMEALEKLYVKFNIDHPADFRGHSLSMSDVVCLLREDNCDWYYCDDFGWKGITETLAKRRLKK